MHRRHACLATIVVAALAIALLPQWAGGPGSDRDRRRRGGPFRARRRTSS